MANVFKQFLKGVLLVGETSNPSSDKEGLINPNLSTEQEG